MNSILFFYIRISNEIDTNTAKELRFSSLFPPRDKFEYNKVHASDSA